MWLLIRRTLLAPMVSSVCRGQRARRCQTLTKWKTRYQSVRLYHSEYRELSPDIICRVRSLLEGAKVFAISQFEVTQKCVIAQRGVTPPCEDAVVIAAPQVPICGLRLWLDVEKHVEREISTLLYQKEFIATRVEDRTEVRMSCLVSKSFGGLDYCFSGFQEINVALHFPCWSWYVPEWSVESPWASICGSGDTYAYNVGVIAISTSPQFY
jgi:hypothetical protein